MLAIVALLWAAPVLDTTPLEKAFRAMYNLQFGAAHEEVQSFRTQHPEDPMGPVSDAAADLFAEFDRLRILQSEFFTNDNNFEKREKGLSPDLAAKHDFEAAINRTNQLVSSALQRNPNDANAGLASLMSTGLHADYLALIEKRNLPALMEIKQARSTAESLIGKHPDCYDAYLAVGVENYLLSLKPAPVRWILRISGAQADRQVGIDRLRVTAEKGHLLLPYARLLLAVAALRDHNLTAAKDGLAWLSSQFPGNRLYREELAKLK